MKGCVVSFITTLLASPRGLALIFIMGPKAALAAVTSLNEIPAALNGLVVVPWAGDELVPCISAVWAGHIVVGVGGLS
jgi:hypothetical protein